MDSSLGMPLPGVLPTAYPPEKLVPSTACKLEELFPGENMEEEDASQEWLSTFLEECLSNTTYCITTVSPSHPVPNQQAPNTPSSNPRTPDTQNPKPPLEQDLVPPAKANRSKRRRFTPRSTHSLVHHTLHVTPSDPPLLPQDCWLADSELIIFKKEQEDEPAKAEVATSTTAAPVGEWRRGGTDVGEKVGKDGGLTQPRKCSHCLSQKTPQWRAGPLGPKTLCNACGVRFKSGRLLPEYRPAKSPTFVSHKHSNSHKKVLEMRMAILSSGST